MIEVLVVPQKDHYEHKNSLYCMVGVDGLGDGVEWIISSRYNLKEYLSVCVGYTSHVFRLCLCTFVLFS